MTVYIFPLSNSKPLELMYFLMGAGIEFDLQKVSLSRPAEVDLTGINVICIQNFGLLRGELLQSFEKKNTFVMLFVADPVSRLGIIEMGLPEPLHYPTQFKELAIRIRRRIVINENSSLQIYQSEYSCNDLHFDAQNRTLNRDGTLVKLSKTESRILALFASRPNSIVSKITIDRELGRTRATLHSRAIDVAISSVRARLRCAGAQSELMTIRSVGYRLNGPWVQNT